jgi:pimeloyl-ACP methyl ester carboxylesterase
MIEPGHPSNGPRPPTAERFRQPVSRIGRLPTATVHFCRNTLTALCGIRYTANSISLIHRTREDVRTMNFVMTGDGVRIALHDLRGGTENLLMLHGVGRAARSFSGFATLLPARFRVRALDFRGHGASDHAMGRYRVIDYLQDALAAVDAIGGSVILYGHSLGSLVAAAVAAERPGMIQAIILEDPPSTAFWSNLAATNYLATFTAMRRLAGKQLPVAELAREFGQSELKTFTDGRVLRIADVRDPVSLRFTASCLRQMDPAVMDAVLAGHWPEHFDFESRVTAVRCPALLLRGDVSKGGMLPEEDATRLTSLFSDGTRVDFPNAGHLLHWQVRNEVALHVSAFLDSW